MAEFREICPVQEFVEALYLQTERNRAAIPYTTSEGTAVSRLPFYKTVGLLPQKAEETLPAQVSKPCLKWADVSRIKNWQAWVDRETRARGHTFILEPWMQAAAIRHEAYSIAWKEIYADVKREMDLAEARRLERELVKDIQMAPLRMDAMKTLRRLELEKEQSRQNAARTSKLPKRDSAQRQFQREA